MGDGMQSKKDTEELKVKMASKGECVVHDTKAITECKDKKKVSKGECDGMKVQKRS